MKTVIYYYNGKRHPRMPEEFEHNVKLDIDPFKVMKTILKNDSTLDVKIRIRAGIGLVEVDTGNFRQR